MYAISERWRLGPSTHAYLLDSWCQAPRCLCRFTPSSKNLITSEMIKSKACVEKQRCKARN